MASMTESNFSNDEIQESTRSSTDYKADVSGASKVKYSLWNDRVKKCETAYLQKSPTDDSPPRFTGMCFLSDDMIILCDSENKKLKVLEENKLKYEEKCGDKPYDVDKLNETKVVVTLPDARKLLVVTVKPGVKVDRCIDIKASCYGIAIRNGKIYLCVHEPKTKDMQNGSSSQEKTFTGIKVIDPEGNTKQQLQHIGPGEPQYLCLNEEGSKIYYSGGSDRQSFVLCMQTNELAIYKYMQDLKKPMSIVLDECENVAFCDVETKEVKAIKSNGVSCRRLMTERNEMLEPTALCYDKTKGRLCVVCSSVEEPKKETCTKLKFYELKPKAK